MPKLGVSSKRALIDKNNTTIVAVTSVAVFVVVFAMVAAKTLASQATYQNHVISAKRAAVKQLKEDITAGNQLKTSYQAFVGTSQNVLGGSPHGSGAQDGDNAKIMLDALPSNYDFPALATTLETLLTNANVQITSIIGTDDELAQNSNQTSPSPEPVAMPFEVTVTGDYTAIQNLVSLFDRSVRPFQIQTLTISGDQSKLTLHITAQTFYQPAKSLKIGTTVVK
jgi:hypothetical protein